MATPFNPTSLIQSQRPNDVLIRLGDELYMYDESQSKYVRLVTAQSVAETNNLLKELTIHATELVAHMRYINESSLEDI